MEKGIDIYMQDDGFYVGRQLKNGTMAKGSFHITNDDIATMFTHLMDAYCRKNGTDTMPMKDANGGIIVAKRLKTELG